MCCEGRRRVGKERWIESRGACFRVKRVPTTPPPLPSSSSFSPVIWESQEQLLHSKREPERDEGENGDSRSLFFSSSSSPVRKMQVTACFPPLQLFFLLFSTFSPLLLSNQDGSEMYEAVFPSFIVPPSCNEPEKDSSRRRKSAYCCCLGDPPSHF